MGLDRRPTTKIKSSLITSNHALINVEPVTPSLNKDLTNNNNLAVADLDKATIFRAKRSLTKPLDRHAIN